MNKKTENNSTENICWNCKKAAGTSCQGYCPWLIDYKPVEGWEATPGNEYYYKDPEGLEHHSTGYHITKCPLYEQANKYFTYKEIIILLAKYFNVRERQIYRHFEQYAKAYERATGEQLPTWAYCYSACAKS